MKFREWLRDLDYEVLQGDLDTEAEDVVYNSRKAVPGTFVCLKGSGSIPTGFIGDVAMQGVKAFVVERDVELPEGTAVVKVENFQACPGHDVCRAVWKSHPEHDFRGGDVQGKTTYPHMIKAILEACGKKVGMIGTTGTFIGDQVTPTPRNTTPESYQLSQEFFQKWWRRAAST